MAFPDTLPPVLYTGDQWGVFLAILAVGLGLKAYVMLWLYRDARARGRDPKWWLVGAAALDIVALAAWLAVRPRDPARPKPLAGAGTATRSTEPRANGGASRGAAAAAPGPAHPTMDAASPQALHASCPRCQAVIRVAAAPGAATLVVCPACGARGEVRT